MLRNETHEPVTDREKITAATLNAPIYQSALPGNLLSDDTFYQQSTRLVVNKTKIIWSAFSKKYGFSVFNVLQVFVSVFIFVIICKKSLLQSFESSII